MDRACSGGCRPNARPEGRSRLQSASEASRAANSAATPAWRALEAVRARWSVAASAVKTARPISRQQVLRHLTVCRRRVRRGRRRFAERHGWRPCPHGRRVPRAVLATARRHFQRSCCTQRRSGGEETPPQRSSPSCSGPPYIIERPFQMKMRAFGTGCAARRCSAVRSERPSTPSRTSTLRRNDLPVLAISFQSRNGEAERDGSATRALTRSSTESTTEPHRAPLENTRHITSTNTGFCFSYPAWSQQIQGLR